MSSRNSSTNQSKLTFNLTKNPGLTTPGITYYGAAMYTSLARTKTRSKILPRMPCTQICDLVKMPLGPGIHLIKNVLGLWMNLIKTALGPWMDLTKNTMVPYVDRCKHALHQTFVRKSLLVIHIKALSLETLELSQTSL